MLQEGILNKDLGSRPEVEVIAELGVEAFGGQRAGQTGHAAILNNDAVLSINDGRFAAVDLDLGAVDPGLIADMRRELSSLVANLNGLDELVQRLQGEK